MRDAQKDDTEENDTEENDAEDPNTAEEDAPDDLDDTSDDLDSTSDNLDSTSDLLELDGSAGGGQLLRTALALSMVADRPVRLTNVRGARPTPGLKPQHLAAVRAAAQMCDAEVEGAEEGSDEVTFRPNSLGGSERESAEPERRRTGSDARHIEVDVGTAGSVTLLFDALLPVALQLDRPLAVTATGGTDVQWSPTMAYYRQVKLPILRQWGVFAAVDSPKTGFYPAGGGEATLLLAPSSPPPLDLTERGDLLGARIYSKASADLAGAEVADRQAVSAAERLRGAAEPPDAGDAHPGVGDGEYPRPSTADVPVREQARSTVETTSTGSALAVALDYEETTLGFDALGEQGKPSEEVGREVAEEAIESLDNDGSDGAVDAHLADQLVVFLALAGGRVAIPEVTDHVRTGVDLVSAFGFPVEIESSDPPVLTAER